MGVRRGVVRGVLRGVLRGKSPHVGGMGVENGEELTQALSGKTIVKLLIERGGIHAGLCINFVALSYKIDYY